MGTTADITAEQHNETRRAAKARQKHNPKRRFPTNGQGYLAVVQADRREAVAVEREMRRQSYEQKALNEALRIVDDTLVIGSPAHVVARMVIEEFPGTVRTGKVSRTKAACTTVLEQLIASKSAISEGAIHKGLSAAGSAIWKGFGKAKNSQ